MSATLIAIAALSRPALATGTPPCPPPLLASEETPPPTAPALPPSVERCFAPFASGPAPINLPAHAVDITALDPARGPRIIRKLGSGTASYYGKRFHGRRTANGERFDMNALTAAHKTLPFGTHVRVTNPRNGHNVIVRINDRGPFVRGRTIDLSHAAARQLGLIQRGHARVTLEIVAP